MKDANGKWQGWGLGDVDPKVAQIQQFLAHKFASYAGDLVATGTYDQATADVVSEMQRRYGLPVTGIFNYASQVKSGFVKPTPKPRVPFFTVEGHMSDMFHGPVADTATELENEGLVAHYPTGYDNGAIPFDNISGENELQNRVNQFAPPGTKFVVGGYSQGMIVVSDWVLDHIAGTPREKDLLGVLAYGNPCRQKSSVAPWSIGQAGPSQNSGLDPLRRFDLVGYTPPFPVMDVYRKGDIFADNEPLQGAPTTQKTIAIQIPGVDLSWLNVLSQGASALGSGSRMGDVKASVYQAVARGDIFSNPFSLCAQIADLFTVPVGEVVAIFQAIISGVGFLANQNNPHYAPFDISGGINWVRGLVNGNN